MATNSLFRKSKTRLTLVILHWDLSGLVSTNESVFRVLFLEFIGINGKISIDLGLTDSVEQALHEYSDVVGAVDFKFKSDKECFVECANCKFVLHKKGEDEWYCLKCRKTVSASTNDFTFVMRVKVGLVGESEESEEKKAEKKAKKEAKKAKKKAEKEAKKKAEFEAEKQAELEAEKQAEKEKNDAEKEQSKEPNKESEEEESIGRITRKRKRVI